MKKAVIGIVVVIVVIAGGYLVFHKSPKSKTTATTSTSSNAPAVNNAVLATKTNSSIGQYLTDPSGRALYTYNADTPDVSNCTGSCLAAWPAYEDKGSTTNLPAGVSTIKRADDGQIQYTYNGMPLYTFVSDGNGQVTGNGVQNFKVAAPSAASSSQSSSSSAPSTAPSTNSPASSNSNTSSGYPY